MIAFAWYVLHEQPFSSYISQYFSSLSSRAPVQINYKTFYFLNVFQVHLITKTVYETLNQDFNNAYYILTKIINFNRLSFYVALTLFWSLFLHFFKKEPHHYYKMYDSHKFFKLLQLYEKDVDDTKMDLNAIFQLSLLISIYQSYVLLNKDNLSNNNNVFHDFFKVSPHDCVKLKAYLSKLKMLIEIRYTNQNTDALMVSLKYYTYTLLRRMRMKKERKKR